MGEKGRRIQYRLRMGDDYEEIVRKENVSYENLFNIEHKMYRKEDRDRKRCDAAGRTIGGGTPCSVCGGIHISGPEIMEEIMQDKLRIQVDPELIKRKGK